jgi:AraC-like DNA-binding protein
VGQPEDGKYKDAKEDEDLVLLPREEKLASLLAQGNITVAEACRQCGFNPTSNTIRNRLKPGGDIHQHVVTRMRELGLTLDVGLLKVREFLDAKKEVPNPAVSNKTAQLSAMVNQTTVPETLELRDNESQRWAAEQTLKLHGAYPKETKDDPNHGAGPIVAIEFVSRQAAQDGAEQRVTAVLDFGMRPAVHNGSESA